MSLAARRGRNRARARSQAGYTLVELMMALAMFMVGMLTVIGMQRLVAVSNAHSKNLAMAERIAQTWAGQLQLESTRWVGTASTLNWLNAVDGEWVRPTFVTGRVGAAFDALGAPLSDTNADLARAAYCTNIRLSWLYPEDRPVTGNGLIRAEIRVFWLRSGEAGFNNSNASICQTGIDTTTIGKSLGQLNFVYHTAGIRQHPAI